MKTEEIMIFDSYQDFMQLAQQHDDYAPGEAFPELDNDFPVLSQEKVTSLGSTEKVSNDEVFMQSGVYTIL